MHDGSSPLTLAMTDHAAQPTPSTDLPRHDWSLAQAEALFALPFADLILSAQRAHRAWHAPNTVQMSTLLSIKTGA